MKSKFLSIINYPLVRNTLKLSTSSAFMMFLPLVVTPILSRIYTPADYGEWGVFSSLLYIVSAFILLSYENTIVKTNDDKEVTSLIVLCLAVMGIILLGLAGIFNIGKVVGIEFFLNFPCFPYLILVLAFSGIYSICTNLANRQKQYNAMVVVGITNGFAQAFLRIFLGLYPIVVYGLIVGNLLAQIISVCLLLIMLWKYTPKLEFNKVSLKSLKEVAVKYKKFPLFDAPARFIEFAVGNLAIIILASNWDKEIVGCFSMVMQFVLIPISIIGSAMANVYYRELSEQTNNPDQIKSVTIKAAKITFSLAFLPILFLSLGGDQLLVMFLGEKWTVAGPMALCMSMFSVPVILSEPLLPIFRALDRQEIRFRINFLNIICSLGLLFVTAILIHNIYVSLFVYSASYAVLRFIMYIKELRLCNICIKQVSKCFFLFLLFCYIIALVRIFPYIIR